jgi:hypothetical protein
MSDITQENKEAKKDSKKNYETAYDGYLTHPLDSNYEAHKLINSVLAEAFEFKHPTEVHFAWADLKIREFQSVQKIFECPSR